MDRVDAPTWHRTLPTMVGRRVAVLGLGKSGLAAAELLLASGADVVGVDSRALGDLPEAARQLGVELRLGPHSLKQFDDCELVVVSPGVPSHPVLAELEARRIPVIGEMELAARAVQVPIVAVGGTNGKSTTTMLVQAMLEATGKRVFAGANLGTPAAYAARDDYDWVVFEVSSFQLERAPLFRPRVSVLLNISEDHLDRYPDYAAYVAAKGNAFENQQPEDVAVVPSADPVCSAQAGRGAGRVVSFGSHGDYRVEGMQLLESSSGNSVSLASVDLHGRHNHENLAAAVAAVRALGVGFDEIRAGLAGFEPLPHRMQRVLQLAGVNYYDDSKATNVGAAVTAVRGLSEARCVLIAGGRDKHGSYAPLVEALRERGRALVVLGEAAPRIVEAVGDVLPVAVASSMAAAVQDAQRLAEPGDAVLLSPACSSFDMFSGYVERGRAFAAAAQAL